MGAIENKYDFKPCPFCGETPTLYYQKHDLGDWVVQCNGCGAESCPDGTRYSEQEAIDDWNKRDEDHTR